MFPWLSPLRPDQDLHAHMSVKRGHFMTRSGISTSYHSPEMSSVETSPNSILGRGLSDGPSVDSLHTFPADEYTLPSRHIGVQDAGRRSMVLGPRPTPSTITQPHIPYAVGEARRMHSSCVSYWQMAQARTRRIEVDGGVSLAGGALGGVDQMSQSIGSTLPPPYPQQ